MAGSFVRFRGTYNDPRRGPDGLIWAKAVGAAQDRELALLRVAALSRLPKYCPDDGLDQIGKGFALERYPGDTDDSYRARLENAFEIYKLAGSPDAIVNSLQAYGIPDVAVYAAWQGQFGPDSRASYSEFWVFIGPDFGTTGIAPLTLGSFTLGAPSTLGSTATRDQIVTIKRQILRWKGTHGYPVKVILLFGSGPVLGVGVAGGASPLTLGAFTLGGADSTSWPIGRTLNDTLPSVGSFTLGGYEI